MQIIGINVQVTDKSGLRNYCVGYVKIYLSTGKILCFAKHFMVLWGYYTIPFHNPKSNPRMNEAPYTPFFFLFTE